MKGAERTDRLIDELQTGRYGHARVNYANGDMVGHTGDLEAAVKAVEAIDKCVGRIVEAIVETSSELMITVDHGNVEQMMDQKTMKQLNSHNKGKVQMVYVGSSGMGFQR